MWPFRGPQLEFTGNFPAVGSCRANVEKLQIKFDKRWDSLKQNNDRIWTNEANGSVLQWHHQILWVEREYKAHLEKKNYSYLHRGEQDGTFLGPSMGINSVTDDVIPPNLSFYSV